VALIDVSLTIFLKHHLLVFADISHAILAMINDLRIHGEKNVLVKKNKSCNRSSCVDKVQHCGDYASLH
jgi:hypothetical protein